MAIASGSTNYPNNFDLNPTGTGTATIKYLSDQERSSITGLVTASGDKIIGQHINSAYTIINSVERTLGLNPQGAFSTVGQRIDNIVFSSGNGFYVRLSGDTMTGDLTMSGSNILPLVSGTQSIGSFAQPFSGVYAKTGYFTNVSGMSPINILSDLNIKSGVNITTENSGTSLLGTTDKPFSTIYTNQIEMQGIIFTPSGIAGEYVNISGDTMTGDLIVNAALTSNSLNVRGATVIGTGNTAANNSIAIGQGCTANGNVDFATGENSEATGGGSFAAGLRALAKAPSSVSLGTDTQALGSSSIALGISCIASGEGAIAGGELCETYGDYSIAMGYKGVNNAKGAFTFADSTNAVVTNSTTNSMLLRFANGVVLSSGTTLYSNQYATTQISGIQTTGAIAVNWNNGSSQILDFTGGASGVSTINLSNGIAGSSYALTTIANGSGTIAWGGGDILWKGGTSGTATATVGAVDLFSFYYNGSKYLGNFGQDYK